MDGLPYVQAPLIVPTALHRTNQMYSAVQLLEQQAQVHEQLSFCTRQQKDPHGLKSSLTNVPQT